MYSGHALCHEVPTVCMWCEQVQPICRKMPVEGVGKLTGLIIGQWLMIKVKRQKAVLVRTQVDRIGMHQEPTGLLLCIGLSKKTDCRCRHINTRWHLHIVQVEKGLRVTLGGNDLPAS